MQHYIFFDLDGTLSDTHALARATWLEILRPYGVDVDIDVYRKSIHARDRDDIFQDLVPSLDAEARQRLSQLERDQYYRRLRSTGPLPSLRNFISEAREAGFCLVLVTNSPRYDAEISLDPLGLDDIFSETVFSDDPDVAAMKPDPCPYRVALSRLGIEPHQVIAFEDSCEGMTAATAAGISTIGLVTTESPANLRDAGACLLVGDYSDNALDDLLKDPSSLTSCSHSQATGLEL
ncbi:HAD family phosphatase [Salinisphaera sp. SPP-AMP-43]|uniref:HAD family hydrolase n=1 Tax=Salinisphaera sp. SPP-AMP-43 TaxID=3121288 RepID=UPI003C6E1FB9